MTARVITTIRRLRRPRHACIVVMTGVRVIFGAGHDDRKGHHYYTTASQAPACVYSSDAPCGHHAYHIAYSAKTGYPSGGWYPILAALCVIE